MASKKKGKKREKNGVSRRSERRLRRPLDHEKVKEKDGEGSLLFFLWAGRRRRRRKK